MAPGNEGSASSAALAACVNAGGRAALSYTLVTPRVHVFPHEFYPGKGVI